MEYIKQHSDEEMDLVNSWIKGILVNGYSISISSLNENLISVDINSFSGERLGTAKTIRFERALEEAVLNSRSGYNGNQAYFNDLDDPSPVGRLVSGVTRSGQIIDASYKANQIEITLTGFSQRHNFSSEKIKSIITTGEPVTWENQGVKCLIAYFNSSDSVNQIDQVYKANYNSQNAPNWICQYTRTARSDKFDTAIIRAFETPIFRI